jgi:hypothetical protein
MTLPKALKYGVSAGVAVLLLAFALFLTEQCRGQVLDSAGVAGEARMGLWAESQRSYQHAFQVTLDARVGKGPVFAEGFFTGRWWGASDTKIPSSPLNAEAGKALERRHGVRLGMSSSGKASSVEVGATVRRRAVHHIWRNKDRHNHFPGSWQIGQRGCRGQATPSHPAGQGCPSIGYEDGAGVFARVQGQSPSGSVIIFLECRPFRWKTLTLPHHDVRLEARARRGGWDLRGELLLGGVKDPAYDLSLRRRLTSHVWVAAAYGLLSAPGWREHLRRRSLMIILR